MASKPHTQPMKKHSQTDLVSRLKTRKMLGVGGEDDDGEVHRSKVSGSACNVHVALTAGLEAPMLWILISAVMLTLMALMAVVFPNHLYEMMFSEELSTTQVSLRLYGGALLSISLIVWNGLHTAEKVVIQWTLLMEACYFGVQFLVASVTVAEVGPVTSSSILLLVSHVLFLIISLSYYFHLGRRNKKP
ncbi:tumor protein p53-inducible protein 11-like [Scleropages formosus]|uniref:Tumor protein p53-inducible protein 11 n=1 Tax=Scleropages formosus TaxID=113540 RepID=A0A0P7V1P8_SCLFO|nr:tumor protein p53-inducible protein 11-like [Scleropages formosus]